MTRKRLTESNWRHDRSFEALIKAMLSCDSETDLANFLRDVATLGELQSLSERFAVARLLAEGQTYRDITQQTGASTTTVTRVARFLENGAGGYRQALGLHHHWNPLRHPLRAEAGR